MAAVTTELKVAVKVAGEAGLDKLSRSLINIGKQSKISSTDLGKISAELRKVQQGSTNSIAGLRNYRNAWRDIAEQVEIGSKEFREATAEAAKLDKQLQKTQQRRAVGGPSRLKSATQIAGTAAAAGVFGGPEGIVGAIGGGLIGGVPGAALGAALGAGVANLRKQAAAVAENVAAFNKYLIALSGVSADQQDYNKSLTAAIAASQDFATPLETVIEAYTKLQASVVGAGLSTEETIKAYRGLSAAVIATGGSQEDLNSALRAASQVFSKGKVSAEELRQQIGERLPGAFTIFADSMGISTKQLDKLLEQGKVELQDFVKFTEELMSRYGEITQQLSSSPELAGQRLKVALSVLTLEYGGFFQKVGAGFQDYSTNLANFAIENKQKFIEIAANIGAFAKLVYDDVKEVSLAIAGFFGTAVAYIQTKIELLYQDLKPLLDLAGQFGRLVLRLDAPPELYEAGAEKALRKFNERKDQIQNELESLFARFTPSQFGSGLRSSTLQTTENEAKVNKELERQLKLRERLERRNTNTFIRERNSAAEQIEAYQRETGFLNVRLQKGKEFEQTVRDLFTLVEGKGIPFSEVFGLVDARRNVQALIEEQEKARKAQEESAKKLKALYEGIGQAITSGISGAIEGVIFQTQSLQESLSSVLRSVASLLLNFGTKSLLGGFFPSAYGNVVEQNKIVPFARGGLVDKPTIFPMANGMGLMGEAGPEAIMPLRRDSSGRLGVEASGGGGTSIVVNVDAQGTNVQGDEGKSRQLGSAISTAVQAELIKQQRPGGLLAR